MKDIDSGLENARDYERQYGMKENDLDNAHDDMLFQVDSTGDQGLKTRRERAAKHMKMDEILDRSGKYTATSESAAASAALGFSSRHPGLTLANQHKPQKSQEKRLNKRYLERKWKD